MAATWETLVRSFSCSKRGRISVRIQIMCSLHNGYRHRQRGSPRLKSPRSTEVAGSFALSGDGQKAKKAGASHYLSKPYSPRELLETIRKFAPPA